MTILYTEINTTKEEEMRGQRIRFSSFLVPPLPPWIFIKYGKYIKLKHWANTGYYGSGGSIKAAIEYIEKKVIVI